MIGWGIGRKGKREGVGERGLVRDSPFPFALLSPPPPRLLFAPATQTKTVESQNGKVVNFHSLNSDAVPSLQFPSNFLTFPGGRGGYSKEVWVELCRRDLQTPTLVNTKIAHFVPLFKTGDTHSKTLPVQKDTLFKTLNGEIVYSEDSRP